MSRVNFEIFLGTIFVTITAVAVVIYGLNEERRMARFAQAQHAEAIEVGASLYEINCSGCHGLKGEGIIGLCPPLNDAHFFTDRLAEVGWAGTLEDYVVATVSSGRLSSTRQDEFPGQGSPAMPAWSDHYGGPLRLDQIRAIAAFVLNWEATARGEVVLPELPTPTPRPEEIDDPVFRGRRVFLDSGCGGCHTIDGLSDAIIAPNLSHIGTVAETRVPDQTAEEYIRESILDPSASIVEGYPDVMPKIFAELLTSEELEDLLAFLLAQD